MLLSIGLIVICGLFFGFIFQKAKLPYIIGMLITGILLGPNVLNLFDDKILMISPELRKIALIIILAKAGLSLDLSDLKKVGRPAVMMCFIPATLEIIGFIIFGPKLLGISVLESAILGCVMGAVSPAIVVPRMAKMMDEGWGTDKGIPQMIVAGSSADDVYVIVIFTALTGLAAGGTISPSDFLQIPISIILGIALGIISGILISLFFKKIHIRDSMKVVIILAISCLFDALENSLKGPITVSGLLAVMSMCIVINNKKGEVAKRLSLKFSKLWVAAEIFLFVLVGATVNIASIVSAGPMMVLMLFIGLVFRLLGTRLTVIGTPLNNKEKNFCMLAQIPKATVQAAIGGIPLAMGLACGNLVLTFAVISIIITAPVGALAIDVSYKKLLNKTKKI